MIEQLVAILEQKFKDLTAEEIADILWLTLQQWQSDAATLSKPQSSAASSEASSVEIIEADVAATLPPPSEIPAVPASRPPQMAGLTTRPQTQTQSKTTSTLGAPLSIPDAPALQNTLEILKALRPLIRQERSTQASYLDVPATVKAIAETDLWTLQLSPVLEPWLELAIVVDATASMVIWQRTVLSLRRVLAQSGVFRDVRMWSMETQDPSESANPESSSSDPKLCIRSGFGPAANLQPPCRPQELIDPKGRRLILVISDCIAPRWETQQIRDMLQIWAAHGPMALIQVLPEWLWSRTALSEVVKGHVYGLTPGQSNQSLTFVRRERWRRKNPPGVKVPVITLEPAVANRWSQMVAGKAATSAPGLLFASVSQEQRSLHQSTHSQNSSAVPASLTPDQRLEQFRNFSSPMARRLAGLLAACPEVNLPIVRMVQAAMLTGAQQVHVAEVLLGGLFKPQIEITVHTPADQVQYVFHEGVQPLVQDTVPPDKAFAALSTWLNHRFGYSLEDFRAYVTPERIEQVKPFAGVMLDVLKRRGGEYAEIVDSIEGIYQPQYTNFSELTRRETDRQDYEIRARLGSSGMAVIAIHGGNLQPGTTQIAEAVAGDTHSFYSFVSLKPEIDQTLYISSLEFDEPTALGIVGNAQPVLSIHGCQGKTEFIKVGGLDRDCRELIKNELQAAGFSVSDDESGGTSPDNICNSGRARQGVQIQISRGLRRRLIDSVNTIQDAHCFNQLVDVLQRGLQVPTRETGFTQIEPLLKSEFSALEIIEFTTAQLVAPIPSDLFPALQTQEVEVVTIEFESATLEADPEGLQPFEFESATLEADPEGLQPFEFESATLERQTEQKQTGFLRNLFRRDEPLVEWVIRKQRQQGWQWVEELSDGIQLEMAAIPAGSFIMGSPDDEPERSPSESPQHEVMVSSFFMGRYPITQAQWRFVAGLPQVSRGLKPNPSRFKGDKHPVEQVSWYNAVEFCGRLSIHTEREYRLPTEAEWEYACRAGTQTAFYFGNMLTTDLANYNGNYTYNDGPKGKNRKETTPVDQVGIANAFGLCDMHGNVYEWCQDRRHGNYEGAPIDGSAWLDKNNNDSRVIRGGSWGNYPRSCRSAYRSFHSPDYTYGSIGFRVVCRAPRTL